MKREDISGLIVYMLIFAVAIVFGLTVLQPYFTNSTFSSGLIYALFILGAIAASIIVCSILLEVGHIIGAKIGKYTILSVNILHVAFFIEEGKFKVKLKNFDGLTGETKILPKEENKILSEDENAVVASLVAVMEFYRETGKDVRIVSIKRIEE